MSDTPMRNDTPRLSPVANIRKGEILADLHSHLRGRTRRRRIVRLATACSAVAALAVTLFLMIPRQAVVPVTPPLAHNDPSPDPLPSAYIPPTPASSRVTIQIARSEPINAAPCKVEGKATVCILSDEQLLAALAEAGKPSGLVRTGGEAYIVPIGSPPPGR